MADLKTLELEPRDLLGKKVETLRKSGLLPVHMYGPDIDSLSLQGDLKLLARLVLEVGTNIPVSVTVKGSDNVNMCFVREIQRHPVTENILHVDFLRVDTSKAVRAEVPIILEGLAPASQRGGTLMQPLQNLIIEALPMDIPVSLEISVAGLDDFEKSLYVSDLSIPENITLISSSDDLIARVVPPRIEEEEVVASTEEDEMTEGDGGDASEESSDSEEGEDN
ncbi:MAG: 50S ribosomal protein L25 [SAR202 cluster bacterium]|nr:50S ribosomal protein L25 [SAR202 cluster bacterium]|tara:strand:+ start:142 stop:810 length:669 start_codon:yes stop_codon:yes gene_type:complete